MADANAVWRHRLWAVGLLAAVGMLGPKAWHALVVHPRLSLRYIEVAGLARIPRQEALAHAGVAVGQPLLTADVDAIALGLRQHPWIDQARVRRQLPDRLAIDVTERVAHLVVALGALWVVDGDGQPFKRLTATDNLDLPVVTGLDPELVARGDGRARLREAQTLAAAVAATAAAVGRLEELRWDDDLGWSILLGQRLLGQSMMPPAHAVAPAVLVHLGVAPLLQLERAMQATSMLAAHGRVAQVVWADGVAERGRMAVQLRPP